MTMRVTLPGRYDEWRWDAAPRAITGNPLREDPLLDVAIALPTDNADNARYGSGIRLYPRVLRPGGQFPLEALDCVNLDLLNWSPLTMLGNVRDSLKSGAVATAPTFPQGRCKRGATSRSGLHGPES